jgi:hypothetical protein
LRDPPGYLDTQPDTEPQLSVTTLANDHYQVTLRGTFRLFWEPRGSFERWILILLLRRLQRLGVAHSFLTQEQVGQGFEGNQCEVNPWETRVRQQGWHFLSDRYRHQHYSTLPKAELSRQILVLWVPAFWLSAWDVRERLVARDVISARSALFLESLHKLAHHIGFAQARRCRVATPHCRSPGELFQSPVDTPDRPVRCTYCGSDWTAPKSKKSRLTTVIDPSSGQKRQVEVLLYTYRRSANALQQLTKIHGRHYTEKVPEAAALSQSIIRKRSRTLMALREQYVAQTPDVACVLDSLDRHFHKLINAIEDPLTPRTNNTAELVIRRFDQHYQPRCGLDTLESARVYLCAFEFAYRLTPFADDNLGEIHGTCPLELAG